MAGNASLNVPPSLRKVWEQQEESLNTAPDESTLRQNFAGKAIVCHDTLKNAGWKLEDVVTRDPGPGELLVRMVATGVCHTDALIGNLAAGASPLAIYPRVLGHEGSGYVEKVGSGVTVAQHGDPIICSFNFCKVCKICNAGSYSHCNSFNELNLGAAVPTFHSTRESGEPDVHGLFFGQSSFAQFSIVSEASVINVKGLVKSREELRLFAPLGCGIQTGSGTATTVAEARPEDVVCITGLGGVGMSAVMGAKLAGSRTIIGIDRIDSRLHLAKELGCTHVVNSSQLEDRTLDEVVKEIVDGDGPTITIESSGAPVLIEAGMRFTRNSGKYIQVGAPPIGYQLSNVNLFELMVSGKRLIGAVEGQVLPSEYVPKMIEWYRAGKFPFTKIVKMMPAEDWEQAVEGMIDGSIIKPVLSWD